MLLLITGSSDGTSDLLCKTLGNKVFRLNYNIFQDYSLELTPDFWKITNPLGHSISSSDITSCFWWKAFNLPIENQDNYVVEEVKNIFREIYNWSRLRGLVKGNPFDFHNHLGKVNLLEIAKNHFQIPKSLISLKCAGVGDLGNLPIVAKSLTSALTNTKASLLTTEVDKARLHPDFPWFLQEKIVSDFDVTVFVCADSLFAYQRDRKNLKGLDWRGEQALDINQKEWFRFELSSVEKSSINSFCKEISVDWGRLDFMKVGNDLVFLEFNANGQWVFLDYSGEDGLVKTVADYLIPELLK